MKREINLIYIFIFLSCRFLSSLAVDNENIDTSTILVNRVIETNTVVKNNESCNKCIVAPRTSFFKLRLFNQNWDRARRSCVLQGGHLASIKSIEEELAIEKLLIRYNVTEVWTGFHNQFETQGWVSTEDEELDAFCYVNWGKNYPDNSLYKRCVIYNVKHQSMKNHPCSNLMPYICRISI